MQRCSSLHRQLHSQTRHVYLLTGEGRKGTGRKPHKDPESDPSGCFFSASVSRVTLRDPLSLSFSLSLSCCLQPSASFIFVFTFGQVFDLVVVKATAFPLSLGSPRKSSRACILPGGPQMTSDCTRGGPACPVKERVALLLCGQHPALS